MGHFAVEARPNRFGLVNERINNCSVFFANATQWRARYCGRGQFHIEFAFAVDEMKVAQPLPLKLVIATNAMLCVEDKKPVGDRSHF